MMAHYQPRIVIVYMKPKRPDATPILLFQKFTIFIFEVHENEHETKRPFQVVCLVLGGPNSAGVWSPTGSL